MNNNVGNVKRQVYRCWMCGRKHRDGIAFLWHIRACEMEIKATGRKPSRILAFLSPGL